MFRLNPDRFAARYGPEWLAAATWYRENSPAVPDDPDLVLRHLDHPAVAQKIEAEFAADTRRRAAMFEALSYGSASFLLTTPGPSLSGVLLDALGTPRQRAWFRELVSTTRCRTFFAVTEPGRGSDAAHLDTTLRDGRLTGEKLLFGNGAVAPVGTVLARTGDGPLDLVAVLMTPELIESGAVRRRVLPMFALPGAQLSELRIDGLRVPPEAVLGSHLKATERGMMGMLKTFHRFRPGVAAMALGHAQALVDYVRDHVGAARPELDRFDQMLERSRELNAAAAREVDEEPLRGALVSLAKQRATAAAEEVAAVLARELPVAALVDHPWLARSLTDVVAYEFMEGTTPIQLANVHAGYLRREVPV
ncbi:acyl-CoA dehydrogenase family protein [Micromonospora aurantiaca (nom. illeg.)]|uniref:acyl-CoA dehydrogenase family protein n=1 Tax=Micromonospora aurantiaca (nom. illeg.) TaxID=47850 RepID=UPI0034427CB5